MSGLYGAWLKDDHDYEPVKERIDSLHSEFYEKYEKRVDAINSIAQQFIKEKQSIFPKLKLRVSYPNLILLVGRYFNDIVHYKVWHEITDTELAKMCAHITKWAQLNQCVFVDMDRDDYNSLAPHERKIALNINILFIDLVIKYFLMKHSPNTIHSIEKFEKIFYLLKTGQYDAKSIVFYFEDL